MKQKKTILLVVLDHLLSFKGATMSYDLKAVGYVVQNLNKNGHRVLLATYDGTKLLQHPDGLRNEDLYSIMNYPMSLMDMGEKDLNSFQAVYFMAHRNTTYEELEKIPQLIRIMSHFRVNRKCVALHTHDDVKFMLPFSLAHKGYGHYSFAKKRKDAVIKKFTDKLMNEMAQERLSVAS